MSDLPLLVVVFWAAINPPAALASLPRAFAAAPLRRRAGVIAVGGLLGAGLLTLAAAAHDPFLEFIEVSPPSFDVAAGLVMLAGALRPILTGRALDEPTAKAGVSTWRGAIAPLGLPLLASPAALAAAISYGERTGVGATVAAGVALVVLTALAFACRAPVTAALGRAGLSALARLTAALLVALAIGVIVDGVYRL